MAIIGMAICSKPLIYLTGGRHGGSLMLAHAGPKRRLVYCGMHLVGVAHFLESGEKPTRFVSQLFS